MDEAVLWMDRQLRHLWSAVKRGAEHPEDWLVIVTTDHGRDAQTGRDHGGHPSASEQSGSRPMATILRQLSTKPAIVDIYPTIVDHMNLRLPDAVIAGLEGASLLRN